VRVWQEEVRAGQTEWRGRVQLVSSGEVRYFREWAALAPLLLAMVADWESQPEALRDAWPDEGI
jgi:hypothetical protein